MRNIVVVPHDPSWADAYQEEAAQIALVFGEELVAIHHIGSTSIPGLYAKPILDIMPIVYNIERVERFNPGMCALGYEPRGENGIPGRRYFVKGGDLHRSHHVHAYAPPNPEIRRHLDFRDYLRAHPDEADRYGQLKQALAAQFPQDITNYVEGKDAFVKEILQRAQEWRAK